jgi:hypothetical protein
MQTELPIVCSLGATELTQRLAEMSAIGSASLLAAEIDGSRAVLRFRPDAAKQLAAIVAAEAQCCAFLSMKLDDAGDSVRLTIEAPVGAESVLHDLVATFSSDEQAA